MEQHATKVPNANPVAVAPNVDDKRVTETRTFLNHLISDIDNYQTDMYASTLADKDPTDEVIANIRQYPYLQKVYSAMTHARREHEELEVMVKYDREDRARESAMREADQKNDCYKEIFWYLVRKQLNLFQNDGMIGIRTGWDVVKVSDERQARNNLRRLLGSL